MYMHICIYIVYTYVCNYKYTYFLHTHTHTHPHTHILTNTLARIHACKRGLASGINQFDYLTCVFSDACIFIDIHIYTCTSIVFCNLHASKRAQKNIHAHRHKHANTQTRTPNHTQSQTHTHTRTHMCIHI